LGIGREGEGSGSRSSPRASPAVWETYPRAIANCGIGNEDVDSIARAELRRCNEQGCEYQ